MSALKILLCSLLLTGVVSAGQSSVLPKTSRPDVVLVTIDTLRADHVHCYGYEAVQTPALDGLAKDGIRFAQAFTPSPITAWRDIYLGGYTFAPVFGAGTGLPLPIVTSNGGGQAFGEGDSNSFVGNGNTENAIPMTNFHTGSAHYNTPGGGGGFNINLFADPAAAYNEVRQPILGYDTKDGGSASSIRGLNYRNLDLSIKKAVNITERISTEFQIVFTNVLNHDQFVDPNPGLGLDSTNAASWGSLGGEGDGTNNSGQRTPRTMEFGFRVRF